MGCFWALVSGIGIFLIFLPAYLLIMRVAHSMSAGTAFILSIIITALFVFGVVILIKKITAWNGITICHRIILSIFSFLIIFFILFAIHDKKIGSDKIIVDYACRGCGAKSDKPFHGNYNGLNGYCLTCIARIIDKLNNKQ